MKLEYIKARRIKRTVSVVAVIVSAASLVVMLLTMLTVYGVQKKSLHDLNSDISKYSGQLKATPDLDKILTVQNQLSTLTSLHQQKPVTSRLFTYLALLTPTQASLDKLTLDLTQNTLVIGGKAPTLDVVSTYTDTLKATTYDTDTVKGTKAFSDIVLTSFGRDDTGATFTITMNFDPILFNSQDNVTLTVPSGTSNQSTLFGTGN